MLTCNHCQTLFKPNRTNKFNPQKFCSNECVRTAKQSKKQLHPCLQCSALTSNSKFCSSSCAATYNNTIKPTSRWHKYYNEGIEWKFKKKHQYDSDKDREVRAFHKWRRVGGMSASKAMKNAW